MTRNISRETLTSFETRWEIAGESAPEVDTAVMMVRQHETRQLLSAAEITLEDGSILRVENTFHADLSLG